MIAPENLGNLILSLHGAVKQKRQMICQRVAVEVAASQSDGMLRAGTGRAGTGSAAQVAGAEPSVLPSVGEGPGEGAGGTSQAAPSPQQAQQLQDCTQTSGSSSPYPHITPWHCNCHINHQAALFPEDFWFFQPLQTKSNCPSPTDRETEARTIQSARVASHRQ